MCLVEEPLSEFPSFQRVGLVGDVVPFEDAARSVTGNLHDHGLGYSGAPQVSNRSPPEIVEQESGDTGGLASQIPAHPEIPNRHGPARKQELAGARLHLEVRAHITVDRNCNRLGFAVGLFALHPDAGGSQIYLFPLNPQQGAFSEAHMVGHNEKEFQLLRERREQISVLLGF